MLPITPAGKYTFPSRLRALWTTFPWRRRNFESSTQEYERAADKGQPKITAGGDLWSRHLHRLEELSREERHAVRMSMAISVGAFVLVGALLAAAAFFGLPPEVQYAMVRFL